jgi:hypothetical protein
LPIPLSIKNHPHLLLKILQKSKNIQPVPCACAIGKLFSNPSTHQSTVKYFGDAFGADNMGDHLALFIVIVFVGAGAGAIC